MDEHHGVNLTRFRQPEGRWQGRGRASDLLTNLPILAFLLLFVVVPVAILFGYSYVQLGGFEGLWTLLWGPGLAPQVARTAFRNSVEQGAWSAGFSVLWGYPVGISLGRSRSHGALTVRSLLLIPFILPSLVMVFGVLALFGPHGLIGGPYPSAVGLSKGLPGILLVNVLFNTPVVALYTAGAIDGVPGNLEEAATVLGASPFTVFQTIWARPSLLGAFLGGMLAFLFSFLSFAPPLILGGPSYYTVEDWIYALDKLVGFNGPALASGLAVWTMVLLTPPLIAYMVLIRDTHLLGRGRGTLSRPSNVRRRGIMTYAFTTVTAGLVVMEALLLTAVLLLSFDLPSGPVTSSNWTELFSARVDAIVQIPTGLAAFNTIFFAVVATAVVFSLAIPLQLTSKKGSTRWEGLSFLPLLISPVILALALTMAWGSTLGSSSTVWVLIVVSQASIALPFALQGLSLAFRAHPPSLTEAASMLGATRTRAFSDVRFPLARSGVWTALLFASAIGLGEFAATNFLYVPTFTTLVVEMYLLREVRLAGPAFAIGGLLVVLSTVIFLLLLYWRGRED